MAKEMESAKNESSEVEQFMNKDFELTNLVSIKKKLTQNTGFLVVGVIGRKGVGKSFLLNYLSLGRPFPTQTVSNLLNQTSRTTGIDVHITSDRVILLDCMPILSLDHLTMSLEKEKKLKVYTNDESENDSKIKMSFSPDIIAVQLISFLLSVCHAVLFIDENVCNYRLLRTVDLAHRLRPWIYCNPAYLSTEEPCSGSAHSINHDEFHDYVAQLFFVANMVPEEESSSRSTSNSEMAECISQTLLSYRTRVQEQAALRSWLLRSRLQWRRRCSDKLRKKMRLQLEQPQVDMAAAPGVILNLEFPESGADPNCYSETEELSTPVDPVDSEDDEENEEPTQSQLSASVADSRAVEARLHSTIARPVRLLRVPIIEEDNMADDSRDTGEKHEALQLMQRAVFGCPRKHFSITQNERFSELCWLEHASDMWNIIHESNVIPDYFFSMSNAMISDLN